MAESGFYKVQTCAEALPIAKQLRESCRDFTCTTKQLRFIGNGSLQVAMGKKDPMNVLPQALGQLGSLLRVPQGWITVKGDLDDRKELAEDFNRHVKMLPTSGLLVRTVMGGRDEEPPAIRAVFQDNVALLDLVPAIHLLQKKVEPLIRKWLYITIAQHSLRAFGLFPGAKSNEFSDFHADMVRGFCPGIHLYVSEDDSFPLGGDMGVFRFACSNQAVVMDEGFEPVNFRRKEKKIGDLNRRFQALVGDICENRMVPMKKFFGSVERMTAVPVGANLENMVRHSTGTLNYSRRDTDSIISAWNPEDRDMFGLWNALTRAGTRLSSTGDFHSGYRLQKSAGRMTRLTDRTLQVLARKSEVALG